MKAKMCKYIHTKARSVLTINRYLETFIVDKNFSAIGQLVVIFITILFVLPLVTIIRLLNLVYQATIIVHGKLTQKAKIDIKHTSIK
jgi:hypothetical protein